jgi:ABC-2 type transport system permease protein
MSILTSAPATGVPRPKVTQIRVLRSEWTKSRSLRSTMWTMLIALMLMTGIGALFSAVNASRYHTFSAAHRASFAPVSVSLTGTTFAVIAFGVLGVLIMSGEYGTGTIRASLTVVPRRLPVLWAKLGVFAAAVLAASLAASFTAFWLGQALLSGHQLGVSITSRGALRSVVGAALYITVSGLIGVTLGALFRNTAAGIATFAGTYFVLAPLAGLLPSSISSPNGKGRSSP